MTSKAGAAFVGLATLDLVHVVEAAPGPNEKATAVSQTFHVGGPAANAAITSAALGTPTRIYTALGQHPLAGLIRRELRRRQVIVVDLSPASTAAPPVSSVRVTRSTGERSVTSTNALADVAGQPPADARRWGNDRIVLLDGHHPDLALLAARAARARGARVVLDAGSWKPIFDDLLPLADVVLCSADFHPPTVVDRDPNGVLCDLMRRGVPQVAVSRGRMPILWRQRRANDPRREGEVAVAHVDVVDTLGAGDVLHGALIHAFAEGEGFIDALRFASDVATSRCCCLGLAAWLDHPGFPGPPSPVAQTPSARALGTSR